MITHRWHDFQKRGMACFYPSSVKCLQNWKSDNWTLSKQKETPLEFHIDFPFTTVIYIQTILFNFAFEKQRGILIEDKQNKKGTQIPFSPHWVCCSILYSLQKNSIHLLLNRYFFALHWECHKSTYLELFQLTDFSICFLFVWFYCVAYE